MVYHLNETELNQLNVWYFQVHQYYSKEDALRLSYIKNKAVKSGYLEENDIYELLELLPRIIPNKKEKMTEVIEENSMDWETYIDEQQARYQQEVDRLHQMLSSLVFLQSAVYRNYIEFVERPFTEISEKRQSNEIK